MRIHFFNRIDAKLEDVYYLVDIYQTILNFTEKDYDQMYYEFRDFTTLSDDKINIQEELRNTNNAMMATRSMEWMLFDIFYRSSNRS